MSDGHVGRMLRTDVNRVAFADLVSGYGQYPKYWEIAHLIETPYVISTYLPDWVLWWMLLGGKRMWALIGWVLPRSNITSLYPGSRSGF